MTSPTRPVRGSFPSVNASPDSAKERLPNPSVGFGQPANFFPLVVVYLALAAGCLAEEPLPEGAGPGRREEDVPRGGQQAVVCEPASGGLPSGASLAGRAGSYRLTLVQVVDSVDASSATGALTLRPQPPGLDSLGMAVTPLYGFTDIDLRAVGAQRVGDPAATDPRAPGVLVLESGRGGERRILLRMGADANRRDSALFDGAWTVLEVREIAADGFSGSWRSGVRLSRTRGCFCAKKVP